MNFKMSKSVNLSNVRAYNSKVNKIDYTYNEETYTPNSNSQANIENKYLETKNINTNENLQITPEEAMNIGLKQNRNSVAGIFENNEIASNAAMAAGGFANGVGNFGENVVDAGVTGATVLATPFTWLYDQFAGTNTTEEMWSNTNAFVAEEHVNNAFEDFYTNNEIGKAMNENASEVMQYGNAGYNTAVGVGYLTATVASAGTVSHVSSLGMASSGAAISGTAGFGKGTSDALNNGATTQEALIAGGLTGLWEGGQWMFGAKIAGKGFTTVALDTGSGAVDPIVRSGIQMIYNDQGFVETLEQNGGVEGILSNAAIAGSFSALGEITTFRKNATSENTISPKTNYQNTSDFFENIKGTNNSYGINQGIFRNLNSKNPKTYKTSLNILMNEYHFDFDSAVRCMDLVDEIGGCVYARGTNSIVDFFRNYPNEFEAIFGYPLYIKDAHGNLTINDTRLMLDLYCWGNTNRPRSFWGENVSLFETDINGNTVINNNAIKILDNGHLSIGQNGGNYKELSEFLNSKSSKISLITSTLDDSSGTNITELQTELLNRLNNGEVLSMGIYNAPIKRLEINDIQFVGNHWIKVTDITDNEIIVSSWGEKCSIPFEVLMNDDVHYTFIFDNYKFN